MYAPKSKMKYEGKGKVIFYDGSYYIGQFKNDLFNGKGIYYTKNGKIILKGEWLNGKIEGYGRENFKEGRYYEGQFKNGL